MIGNKGCINSFTSISVTVRIFSAKWSTIGKIQRKKGWLYFWIFAVSLDVYNDAVERGMWLFTMATVELLIQKR